ncbi:hypothetical protein QNG96_gp50 [Escherichia phage PO103-1]|mgnify:CR=1 FL=1|uniref:Uncharacterized protein n=1 Tax=Escherichia phage PO103-1 TaxID=2961702 RepID=A0A9X9IAK2_9CAUD|nr:hypothetical protein QNG96_gp50 [Escherichia phage PO103-1]UTQ80227.1 hypothetical protein [Escherichia phage PO103-1]
MIRFKDLEDGAIFFTRGGEHLQKVLEDDVNVNAVFVGDSNIGVLLNDNERTFTEEEFKEISASDLVQEPIEV